MSLSAHIQHILDFLSVIEQKKKERKNQKNQKETEKRCCLATASFKLSEIGILAGIWETSQGACQLHRLRRESNQCPKWRRKPLLRSV